MILVYNNHIETETGIHPMQTLKDNLQNAAGIVIGRLILRPLGVRYTKAQRGTKWFSTVAANLAANGEPVQWFPFGRA